MYAYIYIYIHIDWKPRVEVARLRFVGREHAAGFCTALIYMITLVGVRGVLNSPRFKVCIMQAAV